MNWRPDAASASAWHGNGMSNIEWKGASDSGGGLVGVSHSGRRRPRRAGSQGWRWSGLPSRSGAGGAAAGGMHACSMQVVTKKACLCAAAVPLPSFLSCMLPRCGLCELARAEERQHSADLRVQPTARAKELLGYSQEGRRRGPTDGRKWPRRGLDGRQTVSLSRPAGRDRTARGSRPSSLPECPGPDAIANCNCAWNGEGAAGRPRRPHHRPRSTQAPTPRPEESARARVQDTQMVVLLHTYCPSFLSPLSLSLVSWTP